MGVNGISTYPPERGIEPEQILQLLHKDQSLFTKKGYLDEKKVSYPLEFILFTSILFFDLREKIIQN